MYKSEITMIPLTSSSSLPQLMYSMPRVTPRSDPFPLSLKARQLYTTLDLYRASPPLSLNSPERTPQSAWKRRADSPPCLIYDQRPAKIRREQHVHPCSDSKKDELLLGARQNRARNHKMGICNFVVPQILQLKDVKPADMLPGDATVDAFRTPSPTRDRDLPLAPFLNVELSPQETEGQFSNEDEHEDYSTRDIFDGLYPDSMSYPPFTASDIPLVLSTLFKGRPPMDGDDHHGLDSEVKLFDSPPHSPPFFSAAFDDPVLLFNDDSSPQAYQYDSFWANRLDWPYARQSMTQAPPPSPVLTQDLDMATSPSDIQAALVVAEALQLTREDLLLEVDNRLREACERTQHPDHPRDTMDSILNDGFAMSTLTQVIRRGSMLAIIE